MNSYDFQEIEKRWQTFWEENKTFRTPDSIDESKGKFYVLDMFPYPSGVGLHVGHPLGYIATDIVARYKRMQGLNVLHPIGFDAFGLPAEQYAVEYGVHPRVTTEKNISNMLRQLKRLGLSYDWDRTLATTDEEYYKWTQWIFVQLYQSFYDRVQNKARPINELVNRLERGATYISIDGEIHQSGFDDAVDWNALDFFKREKILSKIRLAYLDEVPVNWCPELGTVLANEEVTADNKSERGGFPVYKRPLRQWMLRITAFADRLNDDLENVEWPEPVKLMQRNWIGRSTGAQVVFESEAGPIEVFTTRPDTLFGATYMVVAPEHPLVRALTTVEQETEIQKYVDRSLQRSDVERMADSKSKSGAFTGSYAVNPATGTRVPIWISDYVMMSYGTGAIMAVPAHDQRDYDFAKTFSLPIEPVVEPTSSWLAEREISLADYLANPTLSDSVFAGEGASANSSNASISLNGLSTLEAKESIIAWLEKEGRGRAKVQYKLRDWLFSRQRYWGEPFPVLHGPDGTLRTVDVSDLPVVLPAMDDFSPNASSDPDAPPLPPLGRAEDEWKRVKIKGVDFTRELNTMPNWAGSCWYYLRFIDPNNEDQFVDPEKERYWMSGGGVDLYVGGVEHAVLHLLYARFWHKALHDLGYLSQSEPFGKLFNQGYIQAYAYVNERGFYVPSDEVVDQDGNRAIEVQDQPDRSYFHNSLPVTQSYGKMGKSLKNAVSPDEICEQYGCDTLRLYEMYLGPLESSKPWNTRDIVGVHRFLNRVWRNFVDENTGAILITNAPGSKAQLKLLHRTIAKVTEDLERLSFNTAIASLIELNSSFVSEDSIPREIGTDFLKLIAPLAPHLAEEIWRRMGNEDSISIEKWPEADEQHLIEDSVKLPVQVNGKVRGNIIVNVGLGNEEILLLAKENENVSRFIEGKELVREIYVPNKIINLVTK